MELGRRLLKSIHKNIYTYEFKGGHYEHAFIINPVDVKKNQQSIHNFELCTTDFVSLSVAGNIACSPLKEAALENDTYLPFPTSLLSSGKHYVLKAKGDSMIEAGINDGDYVIVHHQETADNGQIVVACIGNETTLKRIYYDDKRKKIVLHPENTEFEDIEVDEVNIQGVVEKIIKDVM